jgi:hypothetical protein
VTDPFRMLLAALAGAAVTALTTFLVAPASGQQQASAYRPPRAADGHPDLSGIWQALNEANYDIEMHNARAGLQTRQGPAGPVPAPPVLALGAVASVPPGLGVVEGGPLPYNAEALVQRDRNRENWSTLDPEVKCYLPGVPRATYMPQPFQIFQSSTAIVFAYQYAGAVRNVYLKDPGPAPLDSWMGQSVASWDADTLVVDVTGFNDQTWFDRAGNHHSDKLHVVERYTRTAPDVLAYEATIEDPVVFTRPWKMSMPLYRRLEPNAQLLDFKCVAFVEELMYGQYRKTPLSR